MSSKFGRWLEVAPRTTTIKDLFILMNGDEAMYNAVVAGILILVLAFLYIIKSCADCRCIGGKKYVRRTTAAEDKKKLQDAESTAAGDAQ